jgi:hypothetical protein
MTLTLNMVKYDVMYTSSGNVCCIGILSLLTVYAYVDDCTLMSVYSWLYNCVYYIS